MQKIQQGEIGHALQDPSMAIDIAIGPPCPELHPQQPGSGLLFGNQIDAAQPRRFIFKKAHLSREDFRIFDAATKRLVAVSHHHGKNPYESLDPLGVGHTNPVNYGRLGEMESLCRVTGYGGMPSFKIRPSKVSMHGRQLAMDHGGRCLFSVAKRSRIKTLSLRHNLEVSIGDDEKDVYTLEADLMGRTIQFKSMDDQLVAIAAKSTKALIMSQTIGGGSEMLVDVAPGVDWTAICGIMMVVQQVGAHYVKDLFAMLVVEPFKDKVVDTAVEATGTQGLVDGAAHMTNDAIYYTHMGKRMQHQFTQYY